MDAEIVTGVPLRRRKCAAFHLVDGIHSLDKASQLCNGRGGQLGIASDVIDAQPVADVIEEHMPELTMALCRSVYPSTS